MAMGRSICFIFILSLFSSLNARASSEGLSYTDFLQQVRNQNLDLKIEREKLNAAQAQASGPAIPPPIVGLTQQKLDSGQTANGYELSQTIPFPTKIAHNSSARNYSAKSQKAAEQLREIEILTQAKTLYYSLWADQERLKYMKEKTELLESHIKLTRSTTRSDNYATIHLVKAESDLDMLKNDILASEQSLTEKQLELSLMINQERGANALTLNEPPLSPIPQIVDLNLSLPVQASELNLESVRQKNLESQSAWLPEFNLRYKEMSATTMTPKSSEYMVGMTLPFLFFWQASGESKSGNAQKMQAEYEHEKLVRKVKVEKEGLVLRATSLRKQIENLEQKIIPQAEKRMRLVHNVAPRDMETLQGHREATEAFPDLKIKKLDLRLEYEKTILELEKFAIRNEFTHE